ncbi:MAG TPA: class I SAM-dependent methyltransferase [Bacteroidota bacterium]|nr:class I SAM-dependent methyltransferase [Candidatus Kapabacteria bacterium]HRS02141.1 class I SAM-dependent methyltransferase [Bacteroidota bacterium]
MIFYVLAIIVIVIFVIFFWQFWPILIGGAGFTPTPIDKIHKSLDLAELNGNDIFYDLGCGFGDVLKEAEKRAKKTIGVEIDPLRWLISKLRTKKAKVLLRDFFSLDLSDADVIFIFQYNNVNEKLWDKFQKELKPGTRIISYYWKIDNVPIDKSIEDIKLYLIK